MAGCSGTRRGVEDDTIMIVSHLLQGSQHDGGPLKEGARARDRPHEERAELEASHGQQWPRAARSPPSYTPVR